MPSVLQELLVSRKSTRKLIKYKTLDLSDETQISGLVSKNGKEYTIKNKDGEFCIDEEDVVNFINKIPETIINAGYAVASKETARP